MPIRKIYPGLPSSLPVLVAALSLSACTLGPDYVRPSSGLPAAYADAAHNDAAVPAPDNTWWKQFKDGELDHLESLAFANSLNLRVSIARIEEADAVARQAGAALLPEIDASGAATRTRYTQLGAVPIPAGTPIIRSDKKLSLSTAFELDFWGALRRTSEAARAQALASRYASKTVAMTLASSVAETYFNIRALDAQLLPSRATLKTREDTFSLTQRRASAGSASDFDVTQAEGARAISEAQVIQLEQQRALLEHQMAVLVGIPGQLVAVSSAQAVTLPGPLSVPAGLPSTLIEARPDVLSAEQQLIAANARIGVAKAALFPTISLTGNYGGESAALSDLLRTPSRIWSSGFGISLPLFDAGRNAALVDAATAQQKEAVLSYQLTLQTAFREVSDALSNIRLNAASEVPLAARRKAAREGLRLAKIRYDAGYSSTFEVLDAERGANDAEISYEQNRLARINAAIDLIKALGGWSGMEPVVAHS